MILHITTMADWEKAKQTGTYTSPSLDSEGFIHCSALHQIVETANLFFKGQHGLVLLCIDEDKLDALCKYEDPAGVHGKHVTRTDNLFPHVYGHIQTSAVIKVIDFPCNAEGLFVLPKELKV